jgi:magnesium chelatase subunit H
VPLRFVLVTMDSHIASAAERAAHALARELPGLRFAVHAASEWADRPEALARCRADIAAGDIVVATMLFMEDHFLPVLDALRARRDSCDAMVCAMSAAEVMKLTRMGRFTMDGQASGITALLKKLRTRMSGKGETEGAHKPSAGAQQIAILRRLPQVLRFIPGTAQDLRAYFLVLQYWLAGSQDNVASLVKLLVQRYAAGPREPLRALARPGAPVEYPEVGVYHPRMTPTLAEVAAGLPAPAVAATSNHGAPAKAPPAKVAAVAPSRFEASKAAPAAPSRTPTATPEPARGTVGLLLLRSYLLAGNTAHYDGVIDALEARGLRVVPAFATGLDARPAVEKFFLRDGRASVDAVVSLTGFSLVGGPAYNDAHAAEEVLGKLDVPYLSVMPVEFQTLEQWGGSERGLLPVEATMMVAIPELDGSTGAMVYGGRSDAAGAACSGCARRCTFEHAGDSHDMQTCPERAAMLAARVARLVALKRSERARRRVACVLFNFPPNAGNTGTAAFLSVFESLHNLLQSLAQQGYTVDVPASPDVLRERIVQGNAQRMGASANVHVRIPTDEHVKREPWLAEIEAQWGPAPGRIQSDGSSVFVLGERFGNVFVGIQPGMGYEGDPMRLLFERGFAPTHAFAAFYRWLREDFAADAVLHFGTHGALEFMPGKQAGLSGACWPDRLIGDLPNFYLYASNNPSEGTIAKRRAAATLISYLTPPVSHAGLYRELGELKSSLERWRALPPEAVAAEREALVALVQAQAASLELAPLAPDWTAQPPAAQAAQADRLWRALLETETTLIPHGLHVVGRAPSPTERFDFLLAMTAASADGVDQPALPRAALEALVEGKTAREALEAAGLRGDDARLARLEELARAERLLAYDHELAALLHALDGGYVRPAPGGDPLHNPEVLPTGRNLHGFDPFRLPSAFAMHDGTRQAERLLERHAADGHGLPETVALVLWGTDNLKSEGAPIAQALALLGAKPRFDGYGRLAGAELRPLSELGRPRVDVIVTLSGIFRDLLPLQIKLLAEAAFLAAGADEPSDRNFVRKHALAFMAAHGGTLEDAALRVFGNAEGAYGANINMLIDNSRWDGEDELAETYTRRKGFAYGRSGRPSKQPALLTSVLAGVDLAYQNLESVELGVTTIDTYFDTLGGISRAVVRAKRQSGNPDGASVAPVYIGDATRGEGTVRTLSEQVALETRTRTLNPKWQEGLLAHGYEGVRQIESAVTNTMGWSATTGQVAPWIYQQITRTFVLDDTMRERIARLNPHASAKVAQRLLEAHARHYWQPDPETLAALQHAVDELEDRIEGIFPEKAAA